MLGALWISLVYVSVLNLAQLFRPKPKKTRKRTRNILLKGLSILLDWKDTFSIRKPDWDLVREHPCSCMRIHLLQPNHRPTVKAKRPQVSK